MQHVSVQVMHSLYSYKQRIFYWLRFERCSICQFDPYVLYTQPSRQYLLVKLCDMWSMLARVACNLYLCDQGVWLPLIFYQNFVNVEHLFFGWNLWMEFSYGGICHMQFILVKASSIFYSQFIVVQGWESYVRESSLCLIYLVELEIYVMCQL